MAALNGVPHLGAERCGGRINPRNLIRLGPAEGHEQATQIRSRCFLCSSGNGGITMQRTLTLTLIAAACAAFVSSEASADAPKLTVYTYSSFIAEWGPGPKITPIFEQQCGCKIDWVSVGDGAALLSRLKLEGNK